MHICTYALGFASLIRIGWSYVKYLRYASGKFHLGIYKKYQKYIQIHRKYLPKHTNIYQTYIPIYPRYTKIYQDVQNWTLDQTTQTWSYSTSDRIHKTPTTRFSHTFPGHIFQCSIYKNHACFEHWKRTSYAFFWVGQKFEGGNNMKSALEAMDGLYRLSREQLKSVDSCEQCLDVRGCL